MKRLAFIILIALSANLNGQNVQHSIQWITDDSLFYFKNAVYTDKTAVLPNFSKIIPWTKPGTIPRVAIKTYSSVPLDDKFSSRIDISMLKQAPDLNYQLVYEKKQALLQLMLTPVFLNPVSGKVEIVNDFSLQIDEERSIAPLKSTKAGVFSASSVLASGDWFKISVDHSGMHKLSYEQLIEIGLENPALVSIYGSGAILLPEDFSKGSYDDLEAIPLYMDKGSDQLFGPGDFILFYAEGPVKWNFDPLNAFFSQELHDYSERGYYFLTDDMGSPLLVPNADLSSEEATFLVTSYDLLDHVETEDYNLMSSGKEWYGDWFKINLSGNYPFTLKNLINSEAVNIRVTAAGRSNENSSLSVKANGASLGSISFGTVNKSSYTSTFALEESETFSYNSASEVITVGLVYNQPNSSAEAWLNHITINARARLDLSDDELIFRDKESVAFGSISEFSIDNSDNTVKVWDITQADQAQNIPLNYSGGKAVFKLNTSELRTFIAFRTTGTFPTPQISGSDLGRVENQNLHGLDAPDLLIVYPEQFEAQATRLAEHRRSHDQLDVRLVTPTQIYNEFSSGTPNISALRNYLKMYYDLGDADNMIDYLLLFGDGSFDNRDTSSNNPNLIMTYQSANSLVPTSSYVSDDFYGLLDTGERLYDGLLDIGIGRLPVSSNEEAELVVDKIIAYDQKETIGEWRNHICIIGDDEDGNIHMKQANSLAADIESNYPSYNINKIFMDAYPQVTSSTGDSYPDVTRAINDQMKRGALIVNYTGHGGMTGLAHEKILDIANIKAWDNEGMWPLFMTATCEFSRYDEYNEAKKQEVTSPGEEVLLNPVGGSIALFTTTRLVYSGPNHVLNERFYERVFEKDENGDCYRLGDIIRYSKNNAGVGINKRNFTLLGDPSITLSFPKYQVVTDSLNHLSITEISDTLSALDYVTVSGHMEDMEGNFLSDFNGKVIPIVYDKENTITTLANDGGNSMNFNTRNSILYKGNASVINGRFSFSFFIPKDISYKIGQGKISYYSYNELTDAQGSTKLITIGGTASNSLADTTGPAIEVYMNDTLFRNGGIVNSSPELLVRIKDPYGINTTGNGIGHDISAILNEDRINAIILNEYYLADLNSYSSGTVRYPFSKLENGKHSISVKVWDIFNNSSSSTLDFIVVESAEMILKEIFNYPNPFSDYTYFNIEHNRPGETLEVLIRIYDMNGKLAAVIQDKGYASGYRVEPPVWMGTGSGGATLGGGIYVYKVVIQTENGEEAAGSGRLFIKR